MDEYVKGCDNFKEQMLANEAAYKEQMLTTEAVYDSNRAIFAEKTQAAQEAVAVLKSKVRFPGVALPCPPCPLSVVARGRPSPRTPVSVRSRYTTAS